MRTIYAEALIKAIPETNRDIFENCRYCSLLDKETIVNIINKQPTVEAEKRKQERCEYCKDGKTFIGAKLIGGNDAYFHDINYCPNCGAKMESED